MVIRSLVITTTLVILAAAPAAAVDEAINDVRGIVGFWPENYEADGTDVGIDSAYRLAAQYMRSLDSFGDAGGLIYGAEASFTFASGDNIDSTALVLDGHLGYGYILPNMPAIHFEGTAFLGLGLETVDSGGNDDIGPLINYGIRAAGFYTFENSWQLGLDLRFLIDSTSSQDLGGGDFDYEDDGVAVLFAFGKRI